jgi:hypothetical protein
MLTVSISVVVLERLYGAAAGCTSGDVELQVKVFRTTPSQIEAGLMGWMTCYLPKVNKTSRVYFLSRASGYYNC